MPRKTPSFGQLLAYIAMTEQPGTTLGHNLAADTDDFGAVHREFLDNYRYLPVRKNGNVLYHEILSFSDLDQPKVTPEVLEDLTRRYLDLRAPYALAYAKAHLETECPHMHIMISANLRDSHRRLSLSKKEFSKVKRDLEQYQRDRFPFLEHSVVFERVLPGRPEKGTGLRKGRNESERDRRLTNQGLREPSQKEQVRDLVAQQLTVARSGKAFFLRLKTFGLQLYRRGKTVAVQDLVGRQGSGVGRRYRLKTLGLKDAFQKALQQWRAAPKRLMALQEQELEHAQQLWNEQGYRAQVLDVLALHQSELSPQERDRLEHIRSLRTNRHQDERESPEQSL